MKIAPYHKYRDAKWHIVNMNEPYVDEHFDSWRIQKQLYYNIYDNGIEL